MVGAAAAGSDSAYACATLDAAAARRLLGHLQQLLLACQRDREQLAAGVGLAAAAERETLQGWSDATATEWDGCLDSVVHTAMLSQAEHCPTRAALVEDQRSMTYLQLAQAAAAVAATLARAGVRGGAAGVNGGFVPLLATRGLEMITGIYGILLAGAAYVPLDVKWPADRIEEVVLQCAPLAGAASSGARRGYVFQIFSIHMFSTYAGTKTSHIFQNQHYHFIQITIN